MKVVALHPYSRGVRVVVVISDPATGAPRVVLYEPYEFSDADDRPAGLSQIRARVSTLLATQAPDALVVAPVEQQAIRMQRKYISLSWFEAAEIRGVVAEAGAASNVRTEFRSGAAITRSMGGRKADYLRNDAFWANEVRGRLSKAYREAALLAISFLREGR